MKPRNENQEMKITIKKEMIWRNEKKVQKEMKKIVLPRSCALCLLVQSFVDII